MAVGRLFATDHRTRLTGRLVRRLIAVTARVAEEGPALFSAPGHLACSDAGAANWGAGLTKVRQYYDEPGVPIGLPSRPANVVSAWRSHRRRFRRWFNDLPAERWSDATRCSDWAVSDIAQHLISGAQFLGYTLHQAGKGQATHLLEGFDTQATPALTTAQWGGRSTAELLAQLEAMDSRVDEQIDALAPGEWATWAEAPPGRVRAYVAINHFLFDSWVHERDVMLPAGEEPAIVADEAACVVSYVLALAGVARTVDDDVTTRADFLIGMSDIHQVLRVEAGGAGARVSVCAEDATPDLAAPTGAIVDRATGRQVDDWPATDVDVAAYLRRLATVLG